MDLTQADWLYALILFLHIGAAIVGFGSTFVWPFLAARTKDANVETRLTISRLSIMGGTILSSAFIYLVGLTGIILVPISAQWDFSQMWVTLAFVFYFVGLGVAIFLHTPNLKKMLALQEELGRGKVAAQGSTPPEALELAERGKRAGMYAGILHLLFVLVLLDMIFKPGTLFFN